MDYSAVIPAYNEVDSVEELYEELIAVLEPRQASFEILFADDGSTDGTGEKLAEIQRRDARVRVLRFVRNVAKSAGYPAAGSRTRRIAAVSARRASVSRVSARHSSTWSATATSTWSP